jgi:hypothetical protein
VLQENAVFSALSKGLNFALGLVFVHVEVILCKVEEAIGALQDNLTGAERRAIRALKANEVLTILPADKSNATVILNTTDYVQKIHALLEDQAYRKLRKDPLTPPHHPSSNHAALSMLVQRDRALCDQDSLQAQMPFLGDFFRHTGYSDQQIHKVLYPLPHASQPIEKSYSVAFLFSAGSTLNYISRVLSQHIRSVGLPPKKISSFIWPVKDDLGLWTLQV